jgi:hypothetical protein
LSDPVLVPIRFLSRSGVLLPTQSVADSGFLRPVPARLSIPDRAGDG